MKKKIGENVEQVEKFYNKYFSKESISPKPDTSQVEGRIIHCCINCKNAIPLKYENDWSDCKLGLMDAVKSYTTVMDENKCYAFEAEESKASQVKPKREQGAEITAEEYANNHTKEVLESRNEPEYIAHLGLYIGFCAGESFANSRAKEITDEEIEKILKDFQTWHNSELCIEIDDVTIDEYLNELKK